MATDIRVPTLGESVTEATIGRWFKKPGEPVKADEPLVELETDKVTLEVNAPTAGVLGDIVAKDGATVAPGAVLGSIVEGDGSGAKPAAPPKASAPPSAPAKPAAPPPAAQPGKAAAAKDSGPAVARLAKESGVDPSRVAAPTGKDGRATKGDMLAAIAAGTAAPAAAPSAPAQARTPSPAEDATREERVRMTKLRQTIARRLKEAQNTAAMLTTFNDVDMSAVMDARSRYKDLFEKKHGIRLGFMSFFVKACVLAARDVPAVNASIEGEEIVYRDYFDVSIAVSAPKGLVVPVIRNAQAMTFADVEKAIAAYGKKAKEGTLTVEEMTGGTFTISNGGVFGSLLSTPIINPPQSAVLGMHRIEERPVVKDGQIVARPMMYLALSYDHRLVDGREAVTFLVRVKEAIEDPTRLLIDL
ncbi:MAG: 2-oxoglutarate dehydrogenase complex dihydrolipoyllysine-residue succinyltransferase [Microvirga sp.]